MSSGKSKNVLITFVSRDPELNKIGIKELITNPEYGGVSKIYLLYDDRIDKKTNRPLDGWAKTSVDNKSRVMQAIKPLNINYRPIGVNPDKVIESYLDILRRESKEGSRIFIDATSLRRITIAKISFLATFFDVRLFLVVPEKLYDPRNVFIIENDKSIPLNDWSSKQEGVFEMVGVPRIGYPKLQKVPLAIVRILSKKQFNSVKTLISEIKINVNEPRLRDNLRKLQKMGIVQYNREGKSISKIELTFFGKLVSDILA